MFNRIIFSSFVQQAEDRSNFEVQKAQLFAARFAKRTIRQQKAGVYNEPTQQSKYLCNTFVIQVHLDLSLCTLTSKLPISLTCHLMACVFFVTI